MGSVRRAGKPRGRGMGSSPPPWQLWVEGGEEEEEGAPRQTRILLIKQM